MWNPQNIPEKENAPAGNKDISTLNKTYAALVKPHRQKFNLTGEVCLYAYSFMCSIAKFSCNGKREKYGI